jgi:nitrite reductase/ring-hydroxylating ferredoxin subunit
MGAQCQSQPETTKMEWPILADFVEVARLDDVPPGTGSMFTAANKDLALFNVAGSIYAIANACPHFGGPLGMGRLDGTVVTCPMHGMKIDVTTGCFAGRPENAVVPYRVRVVDGKIMVAVS